MTETDQGPGGELEIAPEEGVIKRPDGFWGVVGLPETTYYDSEEKAARVARELLEPDDRAADPDDVAGAADGGDEDPDGETGAEE